MLALRSPRRAPPAPPYPRDTPEWGKEHLGGNRWILRLLTPLTLTGVSFSVSYVFNFYHRFEKMNVHHTNAAGADVTAPIDFVWDYQDGPVYARQYKIQGYGQAHLAVTQVGEDYTPTTHRFTVNGPATDKLYISITVDVNKGVDF